MALISRASAASAALLWSASAIHAAAIFPTAIELDRLEENYRQMDRHKKGKVTLSDYRAAIHLDSDLTHEQTEALRKRRAREFADLDRDGNGVLSLFEMLRLPNQLLVRLFKAADTDADGQLARAELFVTMSSGTDATKVVAAQVDGLLTDMDFDINQGLSLHEVECYYKSEAYTRSETKNSPMLAAAILCDKPAFVLVDLDGNGAIMPPELARWVNQQQRLSYSSDEAFKEKGRVLAGYDTNSDGRITRKEWDAGLNARHTGSVMELTDRVIPKISTFSFADYDADQSGIVSAQEVTTTITRCAEQEPGCDIPSITLFVETQLNDRRGDDGLLRFASWQVGLLQSAESDAKNQAYEQFTGMDKNADGLLVADEIIDFAGKRVAGTSDQITRQQRSQSAAEFMAMADLNSDLKIDLQEYANPQLKKVKDAHQKAMAHQLDAMIAAQACTTEQRAVSTKQFKAMDASGDDLLTLNEFILAAKSARAAHQGREPVTPGEINAGTAQAENEFIHSDIDGDKRISLKEYLYARGCEDTVEELP